MEDLWQTKLCLSGIVEITRTKQLSWFGVLAVGVATLNHKVFDDTVDEQGVVNAHLRDFQEVVTCLRCLVIEGDADVAGSRLKEHFGACGLRPCTE